MTVLIDTARTRSDDAPRESGHLGQGFLWNSWYVAALSTELASGRMLSRRILGRSVLLGRDSRGQAYGLSDRCPHRAVPLSAGRLSRSSEGEDLIECAYHGWRFATNGVCVAIPANADPEFAAGAVKLPAFRIEEAQGLVWIWMTLDGGAPDHAAPTIPEACGRKPLAAAAIGYPVHVDHAILGLVDPAHGPYVHRQWWWRKSVRAKEKSKTFAPSELGFTMVAHTPSESGRLYRFFGPAPTTEIVFRLPGVRWEHLRAGPRSVLALSVMTPVSEDETRMIQIVWSNHPVLWILRPVVQSAVRRFLREDEAVIAAQSKGLADAPPFLWVGDADQQARWYVQLKREWLASRREGRAFENPVKSRVLRWIS